MDVALTITSASSFPPPSQKGRKRPVLRRQLFCQLPPFLVRTVHEGDPASPLPKPEADGTGRSTRPRRITFFPPKSIFPPSLDGSAPVGIVAEKLPFFIEDRVYALIFPATFSTLSRNGITWVLKGMVTLTLESPSF